VPNQKVVLVTGGAGFIGSHLVDRLTDQSSRVVVVDDLSRGSLDNLGGADEVAFEEMDVRSDRLARLIEQVHPELVYHLAAQCDVRVSVSNPGLDADVNIGGTINVCEAARRSGVRRVIVASTGGCIYGEARKIPTPETSQSRPLSPYGISKRVLGDYLSFYAHSSGLETISLALSNVYGPRQDPYGEAGVVAIFLRALLRNERCTIYGDGSQTRDFVYVGDVVDAFVRAADARAGGIVNIGTGRETSVLELLEMCAAVAGVASVPSMAPPRPGELRRSALDIARARRLLGWEAQVGLAEGIARTTDWIRSQVTSR